MKKSLTKWNKFFSSLFYAVLLALPMLSVLARVVYVQANNNSKDSYYGENVNQTIYTNINANEMVNGYTYSIITPSTYTFSNLGANSQFSVSNVVLDGVSRESDAIRFYYSSADNGTLSIQLLNPGVTYSSVSAHTLTFTYLGSNNTNYFSAISQILYSVTYNDYSYLDNVFEYSISKVIDMYGKGNINFVNWFGNMFFDNPQNLLYLNFVNMYLNYTLLVSVAYLMYLFLSFFIQIIRELIFSFIDKTQKVGD